MQASSQGALKDHNRPFNARGESVDAFRRLCAGAGLECAMGNWGSQTRLKLRLRVEDALCGVGSR